MRKVVQRNKRFERFFIRLEKKHQEKFEKQLLIFLEDEYDPRLNTHPLHGKMKGLFSFSVAKNIRAVYQKKIEKKECFIIFTFIDIGNHDQVYQ